MIKKSLILYVGLIGSMFSQNPIIIPDTLHGPVFNLSIERGTFSFIPGVESETMGINGPILGPTLIMDKDEFVDISLHNQLGEPTTIHWHGMHVSAENDGGPHTVIDSGAVWNPRFTVLDKAATYWYHPHLHENTNRHVSKGIAGFILVKDQEEALLDLPRTYGVVDFPLAIQTKVIDNTGEIIAESNADTVLMVNATRNPVLDVPSQVVRLRLLNGSSMRVFNLGLSGNSPFYIIATDGGLLAEPVEISRLILSPGERSEILVDFDQVADTTLSLLSYASELPNGIYGATQPGMMPMQTLNGYNPNPMNGSDFSIMEFRIGESTSNPITSIPTTLVEQSPYPEQSADTTRSFTFTPASMGPNVLNGDFLINGSPFDMDVINEIIPLNNTEIWILTNQTPIAHPFHIHDVQFYILDRNGVSPPPEEQGRKDVVIVHHMETVRFITKFEDHANDSVPYMYHCHMLIHEDAGMMGQFVVVDENTVSTDTNNPIPNVYSLNQNYPNPFNPRTTIRYSIATSNNVHLAVYNNLGQELDVLINEMQPAGTYTVTWKGTQWPSGIYLYQLRTRTFSQTRKMLLIK